MEEEILRESEIRLRQREEALGFKPQKEIAINSLLPYADALDEESNKLFAEIKCNLGKAVVFRELRPGCAVWTSRLIKYMKLYGLKFSKEDHIALIKLVYEMLLIPDLEPMKFSKFATLFLLLTRKKYLISPEELTLAWKPLYDLGIRMFSRDVNSIGMIGFPPTVEATFDAVVRCAKIYFPPGTTKELLATYRGWICPWDADTRYIIGSMLLFLPVHTPPDHLLWWDDMWRLWDTCYNSLAGIGKILNVFAGVAKRSVGHVDWTPYIPNLFARFIRSFNLPVGSAEEHVARAHVLDTKAMAAWIAWTINPDGLVLEHLRSMLLAVESYLHPANSGRWSQRLRDFLKKLTHEFLMRYYHERHPKASKTWERKTPPEYKLRDLDIDAFVRCVSVPATIALHARTGSGDACAALRDLATIRPAIVIPPLLERLRTTVDSLTEPHRVVAAFQAVAATARPLLRGPDAGYPEGPSHVASLLLSTIPGIDPNDPRKTLIALQFISTYCTMVPLVDCSKVLSERKDLTEEEVLALETTAQFEDFVLLFFDRIFLMVESSALEQARPGAKELESARSRLESTLETALSSTATVVLEQCEPKIFDEALRKFRKFVFDSSFETNVAGSAVGRVLRAFNRVDAQKTLNAFVPQLASEIITLIDSEEARKESHPPRETNYKLLLLSHLLESDGKSILVHEEIITEVLEKALRMHSREALELVCEGIYNVFTSLGNRHALEFRSSLHSYSEPWVSVREWGRSMPTWKANISWAEPGPEELAAAHRLLDRLVLKDLLKLERWARNEIDLHKERVWRALTILHAALSCTSLMPSPNETPVLLMESSVPATSFILELGFRGIVSINGRDARNYITDVAHAVQRKLIDTKSDETLNLKALVSLWERLASVWGGGAGGGRATRGSAHGVELRCRSLNTANRLLCGKGGPFPGDGKIRSLLTEGAYLQHDLRVELSSDAGPGVSLVRTAQALLELAVHPYAAVRIAAQPRLQWLVAQHAHSARALLPQILTLLAPCEDLTPEEAHARHKGILYTLAGSLASKRDWEIVRELWPAVLKAPLSEKPSIVKLENMFADTIRFDFAAVNTKLTIPESCVKRGLELIPKDESERQNFLKTSEEAGEKEKLFWKEVENKYHDLVEELVTIADDPKTHWRRSMLASTLLGRTALEQSKWGPRAAGLAARGLIHSNVHVRRSAIRRTLYALKQTKRRRPTAVLNLPHRKPGYCKEISWALWSEENKATTHEKWEKLTLHDSRVGFYDWVYPLDIPAPPSQQWQPNRDVSEMTEQEAVLYEFFTNDENLDKLVKYLSSEEKKETDKFDGFRFVMLKALFRQFGEVVTLKFVERAEPLAGDQHEASQRCAAEILAAAMKAPKHWTKESADRLYDAVLPVLKKGLMAAAPDTFIDWGTCIATGTEKIDPNRAYRVYDALLEWCIPSALDAGADPAHAHNAAARLHALQGALQSLSWRAALLSSVIMQKLQSADYIAHPYQNVRLWVSSIIATILDIDITFPGGEQGPGPHIEEFLQWAETEITPLYDEHGELKLPSGADINRTTAPAKSPMQTECLDMERASKHNLVSANLSPLEEESSPGSLGALLAASLRLRSPEPACTSDLSEPTASASCHDASDPQSRAMCVLSTVMRAVAVAVSLGAGGVREPHYKLLKAACFLPPRDRHDELATTAAVLRAELSRAPHSPELLASALKHLDEVSRSRSWRAREAAVRYTQTLAFHSLPALRSDSNLINETEQFTLRMLSDERAEVRTAASKMLAGLMHCQALGDEGSTLHKLIKECRSKNQKTRRHGVLGVCAYVSSRPYTLAPKLGDALAALSDAGWASDTREAVRTTLADFKRTHLDDWAAHSAALQTHELDLLAELAQPPDYCA